MFNPHPSDSKLHIVIRDAEDSIRRMGGPSRAWAYYKFTCPACGERCAFDDANVIQSKGTCDSCGVTSELTRYGFALLCSPVSLKVFPKYSEVRPQDKQDFKRVNEKIIKRGMLMTYIPNAFEYNVVDPKTKVVRDFKSLKDVEAFIDSTPSDEQAEKN